MSVGTCLSDIIFFFKDFWYVYIKEGRNLDDGKDYIQNNDIGAFREMMIIKI